MKRDKTYDKVIEKLRDIKPTLSNPIDLTDRIMDQLSNYQVQKSKGINISSNSGGWSLFIGFRTVASIAAVFLIGFFAYQQWEIKSKISRLEGEVYNKINTTVSLEQAENLKFSHFKTRLEQQIKLKKTGLRDVKERNESVILNRKSLSQLIQLFEQMEEENRSLKAEILKQFSDTSINPLNEKNRVKSL